MLLTIIYIFSLMLTSNIASEDETALRRIRVDPFIFSDFSSLQDEWEHHPASILENFGRLYNLLNSHGVSLSEIPTYSLEWLSFYLSTVLAPQSILPGDGEIRELVLIAKKIIEVEDFSQLFPLPVLSTDVIHLLQTFKRDLGRDNFNQLLEDEKEEVLKLMASELPIEKRLGFYLAFYPAFYEKHLQLRSRAEQEARSVFLNQVELSLRIVSKSGKVGIIVDGKEIDIAGEEIREIRERIDKGGYTTVEIFYQERGEPQWIKISLREQSLFLRSLIPTHPVSTDIGVGSTSFRNRSRELEVGFLEPIMVLNLKDRLPHMYIMDGHARAAAYLVKGLNYVPAFVVEVENSFLEHVINMRNAAERQGLRNINDLILPELASPRLLKTDWFQMGIVPVETKEELHSSVVNFLMSRIVETVKEKEEAHVVIGLQDYEFLYQEFERDPKYKLYLEDWDKVHFYLFAPRDRSGVEIGARALGFSSQGVSVVTSLSEIERIISSGIDFAVMDFPLDFDSPDVAVLNYLAEKNIPLGLILSQERQGRVFKQLVTSDALPRFLTQDVNLLFALNHTVTDFLPVPLRPQAQTYTLQSFFQAEKTLREIVEEIVEQAIFEKEHSRPALVAVDGWLGSGRTGVVLRLFSKILKEEYFTLRFTSISIDNYRLPSERVKEEQEIHLPARIGEEVWSSELNIGIRRTSENTITILSSLGSQEVIIPALGREVKIEELCFFLERSDRDSLTIRFFPGIADVETRRFYTDVQLLRRGETIYVPVLIEHQRVSLPEEEKEMLLERLVKTGEPILEHMGRKLIYIPDPDPRWVSEYPGHRFYLDTETGDILYQLDPSQFDVIFLTGELVLYQRKITPLYNLKIFVEAEYQVRVERLIREHILADFYADKTVGELKEYLRWQRALLEDQFLFQDREYADYIIFNAIYPDESFLQNFYSQDLSQRVSQALRVAKEEKASDPWVILEDYILPVTGEGSDFRKTLQEVISLHKKDPSTYNRYWVLRAWRESEFPFDTSSQRIYLLWNMIFREIGFIKEE